ncbi:MAG: hypothetical protein AB8B88_07545 [Devosiaceae bacterium]
MTGPILSVLGTDDIVYADGLRSLLLLEFAGLLGLDVQAIRAQMNLADVEGALSEVPFWGDLVLRSEP